MMREEDHYASIGESIVECGGLALFSSENGEWLVVYMQEQDCLQASKVRS